MRVVMLMFDSLNRHLLPPYDEHTPVQAPNFRRLARRAVTFDTSYACSMPCMPARRDLHTGRPNFLHTIWGPLEPYDDSVPQMLSDAGVYTHLTSDHYHYWQDDAANYHGRYSSWEFIRGQEGDPSIGQVADPPTPANLNGNQRRHDWINRQHMCREHDLPQTKTVRAGLDFIERNHDQDRWFLQLECFDPHEPFVTDRKYRDRYPPAEDALLFDWPGYRPVEETPEQIADLRHNYAALLSQCDASLGDVLDAMDRHDMWDDTMLIVWTDHGYLLGEHEAWGKGWTPLYEPIAHTPFFIWDPRHPEAAGERRQALVQPAIDLGPTLLRFFEQEPTPDMLGHDLAPVIEQDRAVREAAIFGYHGGHVNITDGQYVYMRHCTHPDNTPRYDYRLNTMAYRRFFPIDRLERLELAEPFGFTKGLRTLRIPGAPGTRQGPAGQHLLFDVASDPHQHHPLADQQVEQRMIRQMIDLMQTCDAPTEQYQRLGLAC